MSLIIAGIDEAGYGPMLGPMCVGMSVFRVRDWARGDPAPDLWRLLAKAVCKKPSDTRRRIPIADSKALKLANDNKSHHPVIHLERGVLAFLRWLDQSPQTDTELFDLAGAELGEDPWYAGECVPIPVGQTSGQIAIAGSRLGAAMENAGVELVALSCLTVQEAEFNEVIRRTGSKAEATAAAFGRHLRNLIGRDLAGSSVRLVCDQLGGRTSYEGLIARELEGCEVACLAESGERSRYGVKLPAAVPAGMAEVDEVPDQDFIIQFMPEAESAHLPVALASMVAKLTRELAMNRFNRYWCARCPEVKPTAGYNTDARRWLNDVREFVSEAERAAMVRLA